MKYYFALHFAIGLTATLVAIGYFQGLQTELNELLQYAQAILGLLIEITERGCQI